MAKKERTPANQTRRVFAIFQILARSLAPKSLEQIRNELSQYGVEPDDTGLSQRNLQRDVKFLKEELGFTIKNISGQGYLMEGRGKSGNELLPMYFDPHEIQALIMGQELFEPFHGTHLAESINSVYQKIGKIYKDKSNQGPSIKDAEGAFIIKSGPRRNYKQKKDIIHTLTDCIINREKAQITHRTLGSQPYTQIIKPHNFIIYKDTIYLLAWPESSTRDNHRVYLLERITAAKASGKTFKRFDTDVFEEKLENSWGMLQTGEPTDISITFDENLSDYIQERIWHTSQKFRKSAKGLVMDMRILLNHEIVSWILGFGKLVVDVKPGELKQMVKEQRG